MPTEDRDRPLLIATTNPGKSAEIQHILRDIPVRLVTLTDFSPVSEPEEHGGTFAENAAIKALAYAAAFDVPTVADDSGLVIDALGGRPGVLSARYPGETYAAKFTNLYRELAPHARPWTARFQCAVAFADPRWSRTSARFVCEATIEGEIASSPRGTFGFGYDPIFLFPPYGRTLGEVTSDEKLAVAHRGKAFRMFRAWLEQQLEPTPGASTQGPRTDADANKETRRR